MNIISCVPIKSTSFFIKLTTFSIFTALAVHRGNNFSIPDDDDPSHEIAINIVAADDDVTTAGVNFTHLFVAKCPKKLDHFTEL